MRTSLVCFGICVYHELSGINVVLAYSSTIIGNINPNINKKYSSAFIGILNLLSSIASIWVLRLAKNRTILMIGHFMIGLMHVGVVLSVYF